MSGAGPFDDPAERDFADMQAMARRQLRMSLVVGFALLALAAAAAVSGPHGTSVEMADGNKALAAAHLAVALPEVEAVRP
ncbi:MAG: hypothetical protein ABSG83_08640 [Roseiarcus sp.]|jgi:hypothetical protein